MGKKKKKTYRILVGKPEGKRPLGIPGRRCGIILRWILDRRNGTRLYGLD
jgi:hypothetical protein